MLVRHHEHPPKWRPTHDLGRSWQLDPSKLVPNDPPKNASEALADIRNSGEFDDYFATPVFEEMVRGAAEERYPEYFGKLKQETVVTVTDTAQSDMTSADRVQEFHDRVRRTDGRVDWDALARITHYAVSVTPIPESQPSEPDLTLVQAVDLERKVS